MYEIYTEYTAGQSQKAVIAYLKSKQLHHFGFAEQYSSSLFLSNWQWNILPHDEMI